MIWARARRTDGLKLSSWLLGLWAAVAICVAGCARPATPSVHQATPKPKEEVVLQELEPAKFGELAGRYRGKVLLVDFWATWCVPCVELFPHTVQLHRDLAGQGLAVASISMDDLESRAEVRKFLAQHEATFDHYIARDAGSAGAWEAFQIDRLPQLKLYDRAGRLRHTFPGKDLAIDTAKVDRAIKDLLVE